MRPMLESSGEVPSKLLERCNILLKWHFLRQVVEKYSSVIRRHSGSYSLGCRMSTYIDTSATHL